LICEGLNYTDEEIVHILDWAKIERKNLEIGKRRKAKDKRDRIKELNELKKEGKLNYNETEELKELVKPKEKKENEIRKTHISNMGDNGISFYNYKGEFCETKKSSKKKKYTTYYVDENNYVMTKEYVAENYFGGKETKNFKKQIEPYNIKKISQSELLKNIGQYKLSIDVNGECMISQMETLSLSHFHKNIKVGNQLKPSKK
jgi:hypothetical protein